MAKQEIRRKKNPLGLWLGGALIVFGLFAVVNGIISLTDNRTRLIAANGIITIEVVETPEDKQRGLSGRSSIADNEGMLFTFDTASTQNCFWMKDMQFSIDMIWLDSEKNVITVTEDVSPDTFPQSFCPESEASYGLEVGSGRATELGIATGETLRF